jgi:two-component system, NtrC family, response regulator AtoC
MDDKTMRVLEEPGVTGFVHGIGPTMQTLNALVGEIARTNIPVLIMGESGCGKDVYARLIHRLSEQSEGKFHKINCVTLDSVRLSNLVPQATSKFSNDEPWGTVYFDNIEELDSACQRVLLALLPDGDNSGPDEALGARLISSTSRNIEKAVEAGRFRRELYLRLNGVDLRLPPLRERIEDLSPLLEYFLNKHAGELKKPMPKLDTEAMETLESHPWPGNARELENLARRIVAIGDVHLVLTDLRASRLNPQKTNENGRPSSLKVAARAASRETERELILQALHRTQWNRKRAAQELQISYKSLLYKIKQIRMPNGEQES